MKLYLISQSEQNDYDTFDSAVVCAKSKLDAAKIHPSRSVDVEYLGKANNKLKRGVILSSCNLELLKQIN